MGTHPKPLTICPHCGTKLVVPENLGLPYALVGDQPGWREKMLAAPLVGETGELLARLLRKYGYTLHNDFRLSNLWLHDPLEEELEWHTAQLIKHLQGARAVLAMGRSVTEALTGQTVATTAGLELRSAKLPGAIIMPCYNPASLFKTGSVVGEVYGPLEKFVRLIEKLDRPWKGKKSNATRPVHP